MTLKEYILYQLNEMKENMFFTLNELSEEDIRSFDSRNNLPIAWMVQHCCGAVDLFIHRHLTGSLCLTHDVDRIVYPFKIQPGPEDEYPCLQKLVERWYLVTSNSIDAISNLRDAKFADSGELIAKNCLRVITHVNEYLRAIWCILGEKRIEGKWPVQNICMS